MKDKTVARMLASHHARRAEKAKAAGDAGTFIAARKAMLNAQVELWKVRKREALDA